MGLEWCVYSLLRLCWCNCNFTSTESWNTNVSRHKQSNITNGTASRTTTKTKWWCSKWADIWFFVKNWIYYRLLYITSCKITYQRYFFMLVVFYRAFFYILIKIVALKICYAFFPHYLYDMVLNWLRFINSLSEINSISSWILWEIYVGIPQELTPWTRISKAATETSYCWNLKGVPSRQLPICSIIFKKAKKAFLEFLFGYQKYVYSCKICIW